MANPALDSILKEWITGKLKVEQDASTASLGGPSKCPFYTFQPLQLKSDEQTWPVPQNT